MNLKRAIRTAYYKSKKTGKCVGVYRNWDKRHDEADYYTLEILTTEVNGRVWARFSQIPFFEADYIFNKGVAIKNRLGTHGQPWREIISSIVNRDWQEKIAQEIFGVKR